MATLLATVLSAVFMVTPAYAEDAQADQDGDSVADEIDNCLDAVGPATNLGCPLGSTARACVFNAPSGAFTLGHVGWAYRLGETDVWHYGSTENRGMQATISAGRDTDTWQRIGSWSNVLDDYEDTLTIDNETFHDSGYYTRYRCVDIAAEETNAEMALARSEQLALSGYNVLSDNCLTKSVAILRVYGISLPDSPVAMGPNSYFQSHLSGFGVVTAL